MKTKTEIAKILESCDEPENKKLMVCTPCTLQPSIPEATRTNCCFCNQAIWLSPSSKSHNPDYLICIPCAKDYLAPTVRWSPPNEAQIAEMAKVEGQSIEEIRAEMIRITNRLNRSENN